MNVLRHYRRRLHGESLWQISCLNAAVGGCLQICAAAAADASSERTKILACTPAQGAEPPDWEAEDLPPENARPSSSRKR